MSAGDSDIRGHRHCVKCGGVLRRKDVDTVGFVGNPVELYACPSCKSVFTRIPPSSGGDGVTMMCIFDGVQYEHFGRSATE